MYLTTTEQLDGLMKNPDFAAVMHFYETIFVWSQCADELNDYFPTSYPPTPKEKRKLAEYCRLATHPQPIIQPKNNQSRKLTVFELAESLRNGVEKCRTKAVPVWELCKRDKWDATPIYKFLREINIARRRSNWHAFDILAALDNLRMHVTPGKVMLPSLEQNFLKVFDNGNGSYTAVLNKKTYALNETKYAYLKKLLDARGGWYSPPKGSNERPDRLRKSLPAKLRNIIESKDGSGSRLTIF